MQNEEFDIDELYNEQFPDDLEQYSLINPDSLSKQIHLLSSKDICDLLIYIKIFGMGEGLEVICMKGLVTKRMAGDNFAYEQYLKDNPAEKIKMPKYNFDLSSYFSAYKK
jgi:hypothetical protein